VPHGFPLATRFAVYLGQYHHRTEGVNTKQGGCPASLRISPGVSGEGVGPRRTRGDTSRRRVRFHRVNLMTSGGRTNCKGSMLAEENRKAGEATRPPIDYLVL